MRHYPSREAYGLFFIFPGDPEKMEDAIFPNLPSADNPKYKTRYLDRKVDCHYTFMHENLMDMNHQFLHRKLMGGIKTMFLGMREGKIGSKQTIPSPEQVAHNRSVKNSC